MSDVMSRKQHSSTTFQEDWLVDKSFKDWIRKIPDKPLEHTAFFAANLLTLRQAGDLH